MQHDKQWKLPDGWRWIVVPASSGEGIEWSTVHGADNLRWPNEVRDIIMRRDREDPAKGKVCLCTESRRPDGASHGTPWDDCVACKGLGGILEAPIERAPGFYWVRTEDDDRYLPAELDEDDRVWVFGLDQSLAIDAVTEWGPPLGPPVRP